MIFMVSEPARVADRLRLVITVVAVSLCACSDEKASAPQAPSSPAAVLARAEDLSARHRVVDVAVTDPDAPVVRVADGIERVIEPGQLTILGSEKRVDVRTYHVGADPARADDRPVPTDDNRLPGDVFELQGHGLRDSP